MKAVPHVLQILWAYDRRPTGGYRAVLSMKVFRQGGVLKGDLVCLRFWVVRIPLFKSFLGALF